MATPSNMPAYAQGNAQAAAAAKAEAARLASAKAAAAKATPPPTPKLQTTPAPAPQATTKPAVSQNVSVPPKANAAPVSTPQPTPSLVSASIEKPAGMPSYAISNEAAAKNSLANTYDTVAADAKAKADAQAAAFKNIVAPQTDSILKSIASSSTETDDQKRARLLKDGSVAIRARTMTPEQQKAMWGIVIDPNGGAQIAPPVPQQAKPDQSFLIPQFTQPTVAPSVQQPMGTTLGEMAKPTIAPSAQQSTGALLGESAKPTVSDFAKAVSPSTILPSGVVLGEAAKYDTPQAKALLDKLATETYGTAPKNVFATNTVEKPIVQQQQQETQKQQDVQQTPKEMPYGTTSIEGKRWIPDLGWVSQDVFNQIELNNKGIEETLQKYKEAASTPTTTTPTALSNYTSTPVTPTTGTTGTTGTNPPKIQLDKNEVPTIQPPATSAEEAFRAIAQKQIDEQVARKNADLDLQIKQATENRDFSTAEQLKAYKNAIRDVQNQAFLSGQGITQGMANRGLLNSGMYADALLRSGMGTQQQIGKLAQKQQSSIDKASLAYNQSLEKVNKAKADLAAGKVKDVESLTKQLISDQQAADKYKADILKAQADQNSAVSKQTFDYISMLAKENNYDISGLLPYAINNDIEGMTRWLQNTSNLKMSQAGREIQANIDAKKAEIGVSQSQKAENLAQASKGWSDIFGIATDANGRPVKDKNGNVIPTQDAREAAAKLQIDAQQSQRSANTASQANALGWAKLQETINYHQAQVDKADKQAKQKLDMDKEASTRDYFKALLDDSTKILNNASSALSYNPTNQDLITKYTSALGAHQTALDSIQQYYTSANKPEVAQAFPTFGIDFSNAGYLKSVNWAKDSGLGTPKSGK